MNRLPLYQAVLLGTSLISAATVAQENNSSDPQTLETIVVSANRVEQPITETIASVSVITEEDLRRSQVTSVKAAINLLPGVNFTSSGGRGQAASLFTRGTESDHTLILLNGLRIGNPSTTGTQLELIPIDQIDRIEFVRGPRSALYGSDAIGGIIQIFTKQAAGETSGSVAVTVGGQGTQKIDANIAKQYSDTGNILVSLSSDRDDGFDVLDDTETDNDGYRNLSANITLNQQLNDQFDLTLQAFKWQGNTEFDTSYGGNESDFENELYSGKISYAEESFESSLTTAFLRNDSLTYGNGISRQDGTRYVTERVQLNWLNSFFIDNNTITAGIDYLDDDLSDSTVDYSVTSRETKAAFVGLLHQGERYQAEASGRYTDDDQFGDNSTYSLGYAYQFEPMKVALSYGTGYKAPTFDDLYAPFVSYGPWGTYQGNADLQPEESETTELTFSNNGPTIWEISFYKTNITNLITYSTDPVTYDSTMMNVDKAKIEGADASYQISYGNWNHILSYQYVDARNRKTGDRLLNRPQDTVKWQINYAANQWAAGSAIIWEGKRDVYNGTLPGFAVADLFTTYQITPEWQLGARVENLFDKVYQTNPGYYTQDRLVTASARYSF
ncbi:TonB-dependent receptor [Amphritea sp. 2_MG-2023]|uniref:TonB-dependent receptor domain-containing protein n=1 Tax=Amphritea TaxID=515417 RepID=UPI001C0768E0|nr:MULTISPECIES: TonB-dependent receptor [Amphritea]MBU2966096.1 TonB-dependent receptor [Amphritea atlantica]MDO6418249.1 TonB-dependent receptor [Amphritea sp. 2_MG-2023]